MNLYSLADGQKTRLYFRKVSKVCRGYDLEAVGFNALFSISDAMEFKELRRSLL